MIHVWTPQRDLAVPTSNLLRFHQEFPRLIENEILRDVFNGTRSVMGHSMGGHGAIMVFLRKPGFFTSCSAFAPVGNPSAVEGAPGAKAFTVYLGPKEESLPQWESYDSCCLLRAYSGAPVEIMVDQGAEDPKRKLLQSGRLVDAAKENPRVSLKYRLLPDYDHDLANFVGTFGPVSGISLSSASVRGRTLADCP